MAGATTAPPELRTCGRPPWRCLAVLNGQPRNFHRKVTGIDDFLIPTGQHTTKHGGRPAALYRTGKADKLHPAILRDA